MCIFTTIPPKEAAPPTKIPIHLLGVFLVLSNCVPGTRGHTGLTAALLRASFRWVAQNL